MGTRGERGDEGREIERGQGRKEGMRGRGVKSTLEDLLHTHVHHLHLLSSTHCYLLGTHSRESARYRVPSSTSLNTDLAHGDPQVLRISIFDTAWWKEDKSLTCSLKHMEG